MYISILDYSRGTVTIINDTEDVTYGMQTDNVELLLNKLGFKGSDISFMTTEGDPYAPVEEYATLRELCEDVDEEDIDNLQSWLNVTL